MAQKEEQTQTVSESDPYADGMQANKSTLIEPILIASILIAALVMTVRQVLRRVFR
jgi:hypothetical protein